MKCRWRIVWRIFKLLWKCSEQLNKVLAVGNEDRWVANCSENVNNNHKVSSWSLTSYTSIQLSASIEDFNRQLFILLLASANRVVNCSKMSIFLIMFLQFYSYNFFLIEYFNWHLFIGYYGGSFIRLGQWRCQNNHKVTDLILRFYILYIIYYFHFNWLQ